MVPSILAHLFCGGGAAVPAAAGGAGAYPWIGSPAYGRNPQNLGEVVYASGDLVAAEPLFRQVIDQCGRVIGSDHLYVLTSLNHLGMLLWRKREHAEAEQLFRLALRACERVLGPDHTFTRMTFSSLEALLQSRTRRGQE